MTKCIRELARRTLHVPYERCPEEASDTMTNLARAVVTLLETVDHYADHDNWTQDAYRAELGVESLTSFATDTRTDTGPGWTVAEKALRDLEVRDV